MRVKDVLSSEIDKSFLDNYGVTVGRVQSYDPIKQRVEVLIEKQSGNRRYAGIPWPSQGLGIRLGPPAENQLVVMGYVDGNKAAPIILGILSGSGHGIEAHTDLSTATTTGRLRFLQGLD